MRRKYNDSGCQQADRQSDQSDQFQIISERTEQVANAQRAEVLGHETRRVPVADAPPSSRRIWALFREQTD
jgi:hypothetical protein